VERKIGWLFFIVVFFSTVGVQASEVLYKQDFEAYKEGDTVPGFTSDNCHARLDEDGNKYLEVLPVPRENFIYGNHPRIFPKSSRSWINYELSFRFRFPSDTTRFTACVRSGGERFTEKFLTYYVSYNLKNCSVWVRDQMGKPHLTATGYKKWESIGLKSLSQGTWYRTVIRVADLKIYVFLEEKGKLKEVYEADVPLGGGYINFLCGHLHLDDIVVKRFHPLAD